MSPTMTIHLIKIPKKKYYTLFHVYGNSRTAKSPKQSDLDTGVLRRTYQQVFFNRSKNTPKTVWAHRRDLRRVKGIYCKSWPGIEN
ncbi:hypothetical protein Hanom_Chr06g00537501 [Helianthus anomalus]